MKIKTSELQGPALDWAVAKALGYSVGVYTYEDWAANLTPLEREITARTDAIKRDFKARPCFIEEDGAKHITSMGFYASDGAGRGTMQFSTDWSQGGTIIQRERIQWTWLNGGIEAWSGWDFMQWLRDWDSDHCMPDGAGFGRHETSILIAAMRCFVASKLGDEVDVPEELA
jgi:hypothetical protein